jgi:hypothetical protein
MPPICERVGDMIYQRLFGIEASEARQAFAAPPKRVACLDQTMFLIPLQFIVVGLEILNSGRHQQACANSAAPTATARLHTKPMKTRSPLDATANGVERTQSNGRQPFLQILLDAISPRFFVDFRRVIWAGHIHGRAIRNLLEYLF